MMMDGRGQVGEDNGKKRKLEIDWNNVLTNEGDDEKEPHEIEIVIKSQGKAKIPERKMNCVAMDDQQDYEQQLSDCELDKQIQRQSNLLEGMAFRLADNGEKIRSKIKRLEEEKKRRMLRRTETVANGCETPAQSTTLGAFDRTRQQNKSTKESSPSSFATAFSKKMEEKTDCREVKVFDTELQILGCGNRKHAFPEDLSERGKPNVRSSLRQQDFKLSRKSSPYVSKQKITLLNGDHKSRVSPPHSLQDNDHDLITSLRKKKDSQVSPRANGSRSMKVHTVINVDEEESQSVTTEQADQLPEGLAESTIYYPSRDDSEAVEICFNDIKCLSPEGYLTSTIMNFYIRYLQQQASPKNNVMDNCQIFNTYFYKKLKEAVSYKGNDKDAFFVKFRRWWKGVNIFSKAYVLIPIHEDLHWSLVIICISEKEDETNPVILHLDSLGYHSSRGIFDNIKSYLKEEWNYLQDTTPSDAPIAERIWKNLPRRIDEKIITVPLQKNDYDCGLFVLFFMERFFEEAPVRLKRKDLAMFGRLWFKPEEASALRIKIRKLLMEQFKLVSKDSTADS